MPTNTFLCFIMPREKCTGRVFSIASRTTQLAFTCSKLTEQCMKSAGI